jgi:hypothetical protein
MISFIEHNEAALVYTQGPVGASSTEARLEAEMKMDRHFDSHDGVSSSRSNGC